MRRFLSPQIMAENKRLAEATYMKKKMYYNMRIKMVHRDAMNVITQVGSR